MATTSTRPSHGGRAAKNERTLKELRDDRPEYFKVGEVATWLSVSKTVVELLVRSGELPSKRFRGARRVHFNDLRAYEQSATATP